MAMLITRFWKEIIGLLIVIGLLAAWQQDRTNLLLMQESAIETFKAQIENDKKLHEEELYQKNKAIAEYEKSIKRLEKEYDLKLDEIRSEKSKREKQIVQIAKQNPSKLIQQVQDQFGFEHVP